MTHNTRLIPGFDNRYSVSMEGHVFSQFSRGGRPKGSRMAGGDCHGYRFVSLSHNGKQYNRYVHRLVCEAFNGPPTGERAHVHHINAIKSDNRAENLMWVSPAENVSFSTHPKGSKHHWAKLNEDSVRAMRARRKEGATFVQLSKEFGTDPANASYVCNNKTWTHVKSA